VTFLKLVKQVESVKLATIRRNEIQTVDPEQNSYPLASVGSSSCADLHLREPATTDAGRGVPHDVSAKKVFGRPLSCRAHA
jgi:hypothetical protein